MGERQKLKYGTLVLNVACSLLASGLFGVGQVVPSPPIPGPVLVLTVPSHAIVVLSNCTDCSANQTDTFALPQTPRTPRSCRGGVNAFGPRSALAVTNATTDPQQFWKTANHDRNASITLKLSQSLSIVSLSFSLHTPLPRVIAVHGRRSAAVGADLIAAAVQGTEDCGGIFNLSADLREQNSFPRCFWLNETQDEREDTTYPIHVELPVVLQPDAGESQEEAFLALRTYKEITLSISGIGLDDARYPFMAMSDLTLHGRCQCNGHAATCAPIARNSPSAAQSQQQLQRPAPGQEDDPPGPPGPRDVPTPSTIATANSTNYYICEACFHDTHGMQCGACMPGFTAQAFSTQHPCIAFLLETDQNISVPAKVGNHFELRPELQTRITPNIRWFKDNVQVVASRRIQIVSGALIVTTSVAADSGYYEARVVNADDITEIAAATVCVQTRQLPTVSISNGSETAILDGTVRLECVVTSTPDLDIFWTTVSGRPVDNDTRAVTIQQYEEPGDDEQLIFRSVLTRSPIEDRDSGRYFCKARILAEECAAGFLQISANANVFVCSWKMPTFTWSFLRSDPVTIWVEVVGCPAPPPGGIYRWEIDNQTIGPDDERMQVSLSNYTLQLGTMPLGVYQVSFVYTSDGRETHVNTTLVVGGIPVLVRTSQRNVTATDDESCIATLPFAIQEPVLLPRQQFYTIEWRVNGRPLLLKRGVYETSRTGDLVLPRPSTNLAGLYTVTVSNALGSATLDYLLTIISPPRILRFQSSPTGILSSFNATTSVNVTCDVTGLPAPSVRITANGVVLQLGMNRDGVVVAREEMTFASGVMGVRLTVHSPRTTSTNQGRLICMAQSRLGVTQRSIILAITVLGVPTNIRAPLVLEQLQRQFFSAGLHWSPAVTNLRRVTHLLCYRLVARGPVDNPTATVSPPMRQPQGPVVQQTTEPMLSRITDPTGVPPSGLGEGSGNAPSSATQPSTLVQGLTGLPLDTFARPTSGEDATESDGAQPGQTSLAPTSPSGEGEPKLLTDAQTEPRGTDPNTDQRPPGSDGTEPQATPPPRTLRTNPPRRIAEPLGAKRASRQAEREGYAGRANPATITAPSKDREEPATEQGPPTPVIPGREEGEEGSANAGTRSNRGTDPVNDDGQTAATTNPDLLRVVRATSASPAPTAGPSTVAAGPPNVRAPTSDGMDTTTTECVTLEMPALLTIEGREVAFGAFLQNLLSYSTYAVGVRAMFDLAVGPFSNTYYINIPSGRPFAVENLTAIEVGAFHVALRWLPPNSFVGPILNYTVTISAVSSARPSVLSRTIQAPAYNSSDPASSMGAVILNYTDLRPSLCVTFTVTAATATGAGESTFTIATTRGGVVAPTVPTSIRALDELSYRDTIPPELRVFTSTRLTWRVNQFTESNRAVHFYQVLVVRLPPSIDITSNSADFKFPVGSQDIRSYENVSNSSTPTSVLAYVAGELRPSDFVEGVAYYTAGGGNMTQSSFLQGMQLHNGPLLPGSEYDAFVRGFVLRNQGNSRRRRQAGTQREEDFDIVTGPFLYQQTTAMGPSVSPGQVESSSNTGPIVGGVFAGLALLVILAGVVLLLRADRKHRGSYGVSVKRRRASRSAGATPGKAAPSGNTFANPMVLEDSMEVCTVTTIERSTGQSEMEKMKQFSSFDLEREYRTRNPIPVQDLTTYIRRHSKHECFRFEKEYQILSKKSPLLEAHHSQREDLQHKNRYANIFAADDTRVVLPLLNDDASSDYINANYIDGFGCRKEFISTQGPQQGTCADFWRMVWHERVKTIVMLTRLQERGREKCYQYWPEVGTQHYGDIVVTLQSTVETSNFSVRTLTLVKPDLPESELLSCQRSVIQFQFTCWPDYGVPIVRVALLAFLRSVRERQPHCSSTSPIVVHCSAGIGRSGTFIAIDSQINQATATGKLDPYTFLLGMRSQRSNMVQTKEQYIFLYQAIDEALQCGNTVILQDDLVATAADLLETGDNGSNQCKADNEFKILSASTSFTLPHKQGTLIRSRSRTANIPYNHNRVRLPPVPGIEGSDYINASYIDGCNSSRQFIAAETPSKKTQENFWTAIWQEKVAVIIAMETGERKDGCLAYWPSAAQKSMALRTLSIALLESEAVVPDSPHAITRLTLVVRHAELEEERRLTIYHFADWSSASMDTYPSSAHLLLGLSAVQACFAESRSQRPLLLHCRDGSTLCGTVIALMISLSQLGDKHNVDVLQTVRTLRAQRMGIVPSTELYKYIYQCLMESLKLS